MIDIRVATAQFQTRNGDKEYNFSRIEALTAKAGENGARIVSFHELSITSYTYLQDLSKTEMFDIAEEVPSGESTKRLMQLAGKYDVAILAGLVEKEGDRRIEDPVSLRQEFNGPKGRGWLMRWLPAVQLKSLSLQEDCATGMPGDLSSLVIL